MASELLDPILEGGIRNVNFFNGRLLSAEDLRDEQQAQATRHRQLGRAVGAGVVEGLEVEVAAPGGAGATPSLKISPGLAIDHEGHLLALSQEVTVDLVRSLEASTDAALFADCQPQTSTQVPTGVGVYVLVMSPVSAYRELAPKSGLETGGKAVGCGSRYVVEGVQFRLEQLHPTELDGISEATRTLLQNQLTAAASAADLSQLRNLLAHLCFGSEELPGFPVDAFARTNGDSPYVAYGALDELRALERLFDCDVPLALFYWTLSGIQFLDLWAVRRRPYELVRSEDWPLLASARRRAEAEAMLLQFQQQLEELVRDGTGLTTVNVRDYFVYLPPAGLVPVRAAGSPGGFDRSSFFRGLASGKPTSIAGAKLLPLLAEASLYEPVATGGRTVLQLYEVRQNVDRSTATGPRQRYVLFTSRAPHGPLERDSVAGSLGNAWKVYGGLIKRRSFLTTQAGNEALVDRFSVLAALQEVRAVAQQGSVLAAGRRLDYDAALDSFTAMLEVQRDLVDLFESPASGLRDIQDRDSFASTLETYLETSVPGGHAGLAPAISGEDLLGAVTAQDAINQFVGSWTGEGVAIGFIEVSYQSSPRGTQMVPGDAEPYPHVFTLVNDTDKLLRIDLTAAISGASADWSNAVTIRNSQGIEVDALEVASTGSRSFTVAVDVPADAEIGETATLTVDATVGAPHDKQAQETVPLTIASEQGPAITHSVAITQVGPGADVADDVSPGQILTWAFTAQLSASEEPTIAGFDFRVTSSATPETTLGEWFVDFRGRAFTTPSPGVFVTPVTLEDGVAQTIEVRVRAPLSRTPGADKRLSYTVDMASSALPEVSASSGPFAIRLRSS